MDTGTVADIARAYHFWIVFTWLCGYLIHVLMQVNAAAKAKNNAATSLMQIIEQNWIRILARFFVSLMIFIGIWQHPTVVANLAGIFGATLSPNAIAVLTLPMNIWIAGLWGYGFDSILTFIPILKNSLPPVEGVQAEVLANAADHISAAKDDIELAKIIPPTQK